MNNKVIQDWLDITWYSYIPEYFITLHWKDTPTKEERVIEHTTHFNNVLFTKFHGKSRCVKVPKFPNRIGIQHFHEISPLFVKNRKGIPKSKLVFHTHSVLSNTKGYFRDEEHVSQYINNFVQDKKVKSLKKLRPEVSVRPWKEEFHREYNISSPKKIKRELTDGHPILDIHNSDLLPVMNYEN